MLQNHSICEWSNTLPANMQSNYFPKTALIYSGRFVVPKSRNLIDHGEFSTLTVYFKEEVFVLMV